MLTVPQGGKTVFRGHFFLLLFSRSKTILGSSERENVVKVLGVGTFFSVLKLSSF